VITVATDLFSQKRLSLARIWSRCLGVGKLFGTCMMDVGIRAGGWSVNMDQTRNQTPFRSAQMKVFCPMHMNWDVDPASTLDYFIVDHDHRHPCNPTGKNKVQPSHHDQSGSVFTTSSRHTGDDTDTGHVIGRSLDFTSEKVACLARETHFSTMPSIFV
jgi:hypothetical protein